VPPRKLTPQAVVTTALAIADRHGIEALTMRGLASELGVEAMSLYHHFASKDALLDAHGRPGVCRDPPSRGQRPMARGVAPVDRSRSDRSSTPTLGRFR
jgi:hypothetical protein